MTIGEESERATSEEGKGHRVRVLRLVHPGRRELRSLIRRLRLSESLMRQVQDLSLSPGFVELGDQLLLRLNLPSAKPDEPLEWRRLDVIVGQTYVITLEPVSPELDRVWSRFPNPEGPIRRDRLLSTLQAALVDAFDGTLEDITREFQALRELGLISATGTGGPVEAVRDQLRGLMRGGQQEREVLHSLSKLDRLKLDPNSISELRATHDRLANVLERAEALSEKMDQSVEDAQHREADIGVESPEIIDVATSIGQRRLHRVTLAHAVTALIGGLAVSFGAIAMSWTGGPWLTTLGYERAHLLAAVTFPIGFLILIMGKGELFTENFFVPVTGVVSGRGKVVDLMLLWASTLFFNLVAAIFFAWLASRQDVIADHARTFLIALAEQKIGWSFGAAFFKAVFAGWLMTMMTWLLLATRGAGPRMVVMWSVGFLIVAGHFNHVVISASEIFIAIALHGPITVGQWFQHNFVPAFLGNLVGGLFFVTLLGYLQAHSLKHGEQRLKENARREK